MEPHPPSQDGQPGENGTADPSKAQPQAVHKKHTSGSSLFSKFSFSRSPSDQQKQQQQREQQQQHHHHHHHHSNNNNRPYSTLEADDRNSSLSTTPIVAPIPRQPPSIASALQQQKTRRRRGSLRKVALLGRGAQRERREAHRANLSIDVKQAELYIPPPDMSSSVRQDESSSGSSGSALGLGISDITPRPSMDGYARRSINPAPTVAAASLLASTAPGGKSKTKVDIDEPTPTSPTISYTTTDDEDALHMGRNISSRSGPELASLSSGSDSFFGHVETLPRRRATISRARSPLIAATSLLSAEDDWDYSETEWWGWVILTVTWVVFVVGMGSVFGVWSWAWDVGTTPYAPPELEDDPTLPITGYYPCLMILTCVMAWVWVVSAWVGMKYFRHAKISGD